MSITANVVVSLRRGRPRPLALAGLGLDRLDFLFLVMYTIPNNLERGFEMGLITNRGTYNWITHDGKYYMMGDYAGSKVRYCIGVNTESGSEAIEDVLGFSKARKRLAEIIVEREGN